MIRQIRYFQSVIRNNSFSEAAEECHISQSAISQQVQALEKELGFPLLERRNRKFSLTPAGEYFYKKSLILIADYERLCQEAGQLSKEGQASLIIGYLRCYSGQEFRLALEEFSAKYPDVSVKIEYGNHEELYEQLRTGRADLVLNDQRRAFSDQYVNLILTVGSEYIEISSRNPISALLSVTPQELKNVPCVLVSSRDQQEKPVEGARQAGNFGSSIRRIPLFRNGEQITRNYCAFWKKNNSGYYVEEFAKLLKQKFE